MKLNIHLEWFCYEERTFNRKDKVSSFIFPEISVKNAAINNITP